MSRADLAAIQIIKADLDGADLSGADMSGCDMQSMNLLGTVMQRAVLRSASFSWMILKEVDLQGADLRNAKFNSSFLGDVNLSGADMRNAYLSMTALQNVDLSGANLVGLKYDLMEIPLIAGCRLDGAKMSADLKAEIEKLRSGQN
jgi:uncharacterized protein YjbI with pentapeptide repeats